MRCGKRGVPVNTATCLIAGWSLVDAPRGRPRAHLTLPHDRGPDRERRGRPDRRGAPASVSAVAESVRLTHHARACGPYSGPGPRSTAPHLVAFLGPLTHVSRRPHMLDGRNNRRRAALGTHGQVVDPPISGASQDAVDTRGLSDLRAWTGARDPWRTR